MRIVPNDEQARALELVRLWWAASDSPSTFRLFGYAGTGKSSLIPLIIDMLNVHGEVVTLTNKAASVLRSKGVGGARTIHSFIYRLVDDQAADARGRHVLEFERLEKLTYRPQLIIVDEASMVGAQIGKDLASFDIPILAIGDPGQLPPVNDQPYFTLLHPDVQLETIMRTEGRDIIDLATAARTGSPLATKGANALVARRAAILEPVLDAGLQQADTVLATTHRLRRQLNYRLRSLRGKAPLPEVGDELICMRRAYELVNGYTYTVTSVEWDEPSLVLKLDDGMTTLTYHMNIAHFLMASLPEGVEWYCDETQTYYQGVPNELYNLDFASVLTAHKAQGSEWNKVLCFLNGWLGDDAKKMRYTAITRAAKQVAVLV